MDDVEYEVVQESRVRLLQLVQALDSLFASGGEMPEQRGVSTTGGCTLLRHGVRTSCRKGPSLSLLTAMM